MRRLTRIVAAALLAFSMVFAGASVAAAVGGGMQIVVEFPDGSTLTLDVESSDTIDNVKQKVQDQTGITPAEMQLIYAAKTLEEGRVLSDYNINDGDTVLIVPRVPLTVSTVTLPAFVIDAPYSFLVSAAGGLGVPTYAVTAGALPGGITLDPTSGVLSGTPRAIGPWSFTVTVTAGRVATTQTYSGVIAPQLAATGPAADLGAALGVAGLLALLGVVLVRRSRRGALAAH